MGFVAASTAGRQVRVWLLSGVALGALGTAAPFPAHADDQTANLTEIIVTAEKRAERVQDVPISVGVVTNEQIEKQGIINVDDFAGMIPNVQTILPYGPQEPQYSIRGVTETDYSPNQSSPIAMYVDGVFKSVGALQAMQLFDTDRVEVLKGAQGTLQGRNATGGAIQIYTVKPSFDENGFLTVGGGEYGRYEASGAYNIPLIDNVLALRVAGTFTNVDGYIHNAGPDAPYGGGLTGVYDYAGRVSLLWKPTENFDALLRLESARSDPVNYGEYSRGIGPGGIGIPDGYLGELGTSTKSFDGFPLSSYFGSPSGGYVSIPQGEYGLSGVTRNGLGYYDNNNGDQDVHRRLIKSRSASLEMNYAVTPALKLTSITGWDGGQWDSVENDAGAPQNIQEAEYYSRIHSFQEELRLTSSFDGPYNFILGALYDHESLYYYDWAGWALYQPAIVKDTAGQLVNICLLTQFYTCVTSNSFNQTRTDYATYLNQTLKLWDGLQATVGVRYTDDSVGVQHYRAAFSWYDQNGVLQTYNSLPGIQNDPAAGMNEGLSDHKWIGKFGLDYHLTPDNMVYGSWSLGFRGSAFNAAAVLPSALNGVKPETLIDYEVGSKNQFLDHTLQVNVAGFYYIYRNQQFATLDPVTGLSDEYNLPKVNSYGVELDFLYRPIKTLTLDLSGGYLYSIYQSGIVGDVEIGGNQVEVSPRWSASGSVDWRMVDLDWASLDLYVDGQAVTKQYFNANNTAPSLEPGRAVFDARLTAELPDYHDMTVSLYVDNLFDKHYETVLYDEEALLNYTNAQRGNPRAVGVQATVRF